MHAPRARPPCTLAVHAPATQRSDQRTVLLPFSTLATYVPDGDHDTELMAELEETGSHVTMRRSHVTTQSNQITVVRVVRLQFQSNRLLVVPVQGAVQLARQHVPHIEGAIGGSSSHVDAVRTVDKHV